MRSVSSSSGSFEGISFEIEDLEAALAWASIQTVRVCIMTDHRAAPEVIEVYAPGAEAPRWLLWRDYEGKLHVDDWGTAQFDLPYSSVRAGLGFIEGRLGGNLRPTSER